MSVSEITISDSVSVVGLGESAHGMEKGIQWKNFRGTLQQTRERGL